MHSESVKDPEKIRNRFQIITVVTFNWPNGIFKPSFTENAFALVEYRFSKGKK